jgi:uncharacterized protein (DUF58 family)
VRARGALRPTSLGVKAGLFYLLLVAAFFAAPYANLFFLLLLFVSVLGLWDLVAARRNLAGVTGHVEEAEPVPAGAGAALSAALEAGRRRWALGVEVSLEGAGTVRAALGEAGGPVRVAVPLPALARGVHRVRAARVFSSWPLGLWKARRAIPAPSELVVYPAPAALATSRGAGGGVGELYDLLGAAHGFLQPSELREYRPGDELRLVHWKASARRGTLVIKEWEGGTGSGHEVVLDLRAEGEELEEGLSAVSALALAAKEQKEVLTVHSQGLSATFGAGHRPWKELLRFLAAAAPLPKDGPAPPVVSPAVLRLPRRGGAAGPAGGRR